MCLVLNMENTSADAPGSVLLDQNNFNTQEVTVEVQNQQENLNLNEDSSAFSPGTVRCMRNNPSYSSCIMSFIAACISANSDCCKWPFSITELKI